MLGSMKGVKMSGLTKKLFELILGLRREELEAAKSYRMLQVYGSTMAYVPLMISPVLTYSLFAILALRGDTVFNPTQLFTSYALLSQPLFTTFAGMMELLSAIGCFERIQTFLSSETRSDQRLLKDSKTDETQVGLTGRTTIELNDQIELVVLSPREEQMRNPAAQIGKLSIQDGYFGWKESGRSVLHNINIIIPPKKLTLLIGPVASGKTTLLKAFLGETPMYRGIVESSNSEIAWCEQSPWLVV